MPKLKSERVPTNQTVEKTPPNSGKNIDLRSIRENMGKFAKPLLAFLILTGGYGIVDAQEPTGTEVAGELGNRMEVGPDGVNLRTNPTVAENTFVRFLEPGTNLMIGETTESGGFLWGRVLAIEDSTGTMVPQTQESYVVVNYLNDIPEETPAAEAAPEAPTESPMASETAAPLTTVSPTEVPPIVTPDALFAQETAAVAHIISQGAVDSNFVLVPEGFSFGVDRLSVRSAENGNAAIRDGILGRGRPWIEGALGALGFSPEYVQEYIDGGGAGLYMMGESAVDRHLQINRLGSWGTTMFVVPTEGAVPTLIPAFHSTAFSTAQYGDIILRDTAVEEAVQGPLYRTMFNLQAMHPDYMAYWGFPDQDSLVESLSQNGHLRAFMEYAQHAAIQNVYQGWNNNSYRHQIGAGEVGGTFALRQDVIDLVNTAMGTRYTTLQEVLPYFGNPDLLMELNFRFRNWSRDTLGTEYNVWDAFGLYRQGGVSIPPLVNYNF